MNSETFPRHLITQDRVAVALERQVILRYAKDAKRILDVGCGTGGTLEWLAGQLSGNDIALLGVEPLHGCVSTEFTGAGYGTGFLIFQGDHTTITGRYDLIYTQRMLIQLPTWEAQLEAIQLLRSHLTPKGRLVCVEPSRDGLSNLNAMRRSVGLPDIIPPGHTHYTMFDCHECPGLIYRYHFGQHYSFLSRVVEAYRAQQEGREPRYMDPESVEGRLCLALPDTGECFGQYHYSVWGPA